MPILTRHSLWTAHKEISLQLDNDLTHYFQFDFCQKRKNSRFVLILSKIKFPNLAVFGLLD